MGTLASTEMLRLLSSRHVCELIMRQIVNRIGQEQFTVESIPAVWAEAGISSPAAYSSRCPPSLLIDIWQAVALSSDVQTRGFMRRVTWPRFKYRPHPGLQIEVRWLQLTSQNEMLRLHIHAAMKVAFVWTVFIPRPSRICLSHAGNLQTHIHCVQKQSENWTFPRGLELDDEQLCMKPPLNQPMGVRGCQWCIRPLQGNKSGMLWVVLF